MRNRIFVAAGVIGIIGVAWYFGQPKKLGVPVPKPAVEVAEASPSKPTAPAETPKPLPEGLDLSRAFNPASDEEISPLVLASFENPEPKPAPVPVARYRSLLIGLDTLNPIGLRLGWLSVPLPENDVLDIMPREVGK
ncbi:hypothetical protein [Zavarzinella formosa]|uniref:hypothetical protein n=1 Tax=Zavarzinella formosa TaxID=360055 RepID=UPI0012FA4042|nr:hypothetical protein [Zavarzinella formosa]